MVGMKGRLVHLRQVLEDCNELVMEALEVIENTLTLQGIPLDIVNLLTIFCFDTAWDKDNEMMQNSVTYGANADIDEIDERKFVNLQLEPDLTVMFGDVTENAGDALL